jgi:hypothetical protein
MVFVPVVGQPYFEYVVRYRSPQTPVWTYEHFPTSGDARIRYDALRTKTVLIRPSVTPLPPMSEWESAHFIVEMYRDTPQLLQQSS